MIATYLETTGQLRGADWQRDQEDWGVWWWTVFHHTRDTDANSLAWRAEYGGEMVANIRHYLKVWKPVRSGTGVCWSSDWDESASTERVRVVPPEEIVEAGGAAEWIATWSSLPDSLALPMLIPELFKRDPE